MSQFTVTIEERRAVHLAGMFIHTDMQKCQNDCHTLWDAFAPRMGELCPGEPRESYGVSFPIDAAAGSFTYWAALEFPAGNPLPQGMAETALPAGLYAACPVAGLDDILAAYTHMYTEWPTTQSSYALRHDTPCYEFYSADHLKTGAFTLYIPVAAK